MIAKTTTERVREYRQRKTEAGEPEVRGIYAPKDSHDAIRAAARAVADDAPIYTLVTWDWIRTAVKRQAKRLNKGK